MQQRYFTGVPATAPFRYTIEWHAGAGSTINVMNRKHYLRITGRKDVTGISASRKGGEVGR